MTSPFPVKVPEEKDDACAEHAACQDGVAVTSAWSNRFRETSQTPLVTSSRRRVTRHDSNRRRRRCCYCCWRPRRTSRHHYVIEHQVMRDFFITHIPARISVAAPQEWTLRPSWRSTLMHAAVICGFGHTTFCVKYVRVIVCRSKIIVLCWEFG